MINESKQGVFDESLLIALLTSLPTQKELVAVKDLVKKIEPKAVVHCDFQTSLTFCLKGLDRIYSLLHLVSVPALRTIYISESNTCKLISSEFENVKYELVSVGTDFLNDNQLIDCLNHGTLKKD